MHAIRTQCETVPNRTHVPYIPLFVIFLTVMATDANSAIAKQQNADANSFIASQNTKQSYNLKLQQLAQTAADSKVESSYRIGAEDLLSITVYSAPELNRTVRVSEQGTIALPLIGDVPAAGFTARQLEMVIEELLNRSYMNDPQVTVFVQEMQSHPVAVFGAVGKPGIYQIQGPKSLIEVLSLAQGLADDAGDKVIVMRRSGAASAASANSLTPEIAHSISLRSVSARPEPITDSKNSAESMQIDLKELLSSTSPVYNIQVKPGDIVKVPHAGIVYVVGEVRKPGGFLLRANESISVLQALALAEGTTSTSSQKAARIIRTSKSGAREEIRINLKKILAGKEADPVLLSHDILFVPNSTGKSAFYRGAEAAVSITAGLIVYRW